MHSPLAMRTSDFLQAQLGVRLGRQYLCQLGAHRGDPGKPEIERGRAMTGRNGIHDEGGAGDCIAAGKDARHVGGQVIPDRLHPPTAQALHLLQAARLRALTDGKDDHIGRDDFFGLGEFIEIRSSFDKAAEIDLDRAHTGHLTISAW